AAVVLQQQIGVAVAVEITRPLDVPIGAGVAQICSTGDRAAIAPPDVGVAAVVLQQNARAVTLPCEIGARSAIKAAVARDAPARPGIAEAGPADHAGAVELPDHGLTAAVLPQDVRIAV